MSFLYFMLVAVSIVESYGVRDSTSYGYTHGFNNAPEPNTALTACVQTIGGSPLSGASASPNGTIVPANGIPEQGESCIYAIMSVDPSKTITVTCSSFGQLGMLLYPPASNQDDGGLSITPNKPYTVTGGFVHVTILSDDVQITPSCSWSIA